MSFSKRARTTSPGKRVMKRKKANQSRSPSGEALDDESEDEDFLLFEKIRSVDRSSKGDEKAKLHSKSSAEIGTDSSPSETTKSEMKSKNNNKKKAKNDIGDIFSSGKQEARQNMASLANTKKCPGGHRVNPMRTSHAGFYCDLCKIKNLPKGTWMFGCRTCDWDACRKCMASYDPKKAAADLAHQTAKAQLEKSAKKGGASNVVWIDDGLGGVYDQEGWTGRKTGDGLRIFKGLHSKNKGGGGTPLCPIDCECCV